MSIKEKIIGKLNILLSHNDRDISLKIEESASQIAENFNIDKNKISVAALLLNYGKFIDENELGSTAEDLGIDVDNYEHDEEKLYAVVGAEIAKFDFDIEDEEILDVIRTQNQPSENYSDLQKVVFIASVLNTDYGLTVKDEIGEALKEKDLDEAFKLSTESFIKREYIDNHETYQKEQESTGDIESAEDSEDIEEIEQEIREKEIEEENNFFKQEEEQAEFVLKRHRDAPSDPLKRKKSIKIKLSKIKIFLVIVSILLITVLLTFGFIWIVEKYIRQDNKSINVSRKKNVTVKTLERKFYDKPLSLILFYNQNNIKKAAVIIYDEFLKKPLVINIPSDLVIDIPGFGFKDVNTMIDKTEPETATLAISNQLAIKVYHYVISQQKIFDLKSEQVIKSILSENNPGNISSVERVDFYNNIKNKKINIVMTTIPQRKLEIEGKSFSQVKNDELGKFYSGFELAKKLYVKDRKSVAILNGAGDARIVHVISKLLNLNDYYIIHMGNAKTPDGKDDFGRKITEIRAETKYKSDASKIFKLLGKGVIKYGIDVASVADLTITVGSDLSGKIATPTISFSKEN